MADQGLYLIVTGHNQQAKCDVANALLGAKKRLKPMRCRRKIQEVCSKTIHGFQMYIVATPKLNTPAWTRTEKSIEKLAAKILIYVQDNANFDSDDKGSLQMLNDLFSVEEKTVEILVIHYDEKNPQRFRRQSSFQGCAQESPAEVTADKDFEFKFRKWDPVPRKLQIADEIKKRIQQLLNVKPVEFEGSVDVDDTRKVPFADASLPKRDDQDLNKKIVDSMTTLTGTSDDADVELKYFPLPELKSDDWTLYSYALTVGKARTDHVRVNVVGNQAAGKTTLVHRLQMKNVKCPNREQRPTEGIEINQVTTRCLEKDGKRIWNEKSSGYQSELNLQRMAMSCQFAKRLRQENEARAQLKFDSEKSGHSGIGDETKLCKKTTSFEIEQGSEEVETSDITKTYHYTDQVDQEKRAFYLKEVKLWEKYQGEERMYISYWDFAGQATYYSTHQAFLAPSSVYVLVIDLSLGLEEKIKDKVSFNTGQLRTYTVEESVKFWISSIKAYTRDEYNGHAPFIVVGTHKDKVTSEEINSKFCRIRELMAGIAQVEFIAIDNTLPVSTDNDLKELRDKIMDIALGVIDEEIPAQWIDLERKIIEEKDKGKRILSLADIEELDAKAEKPMKNRERIISFLNHQHSRGWLMHFCHIQLEDIIILDPGLLAHFFSTLLQKVPDYKFQSSCQSRGGVIYQKFINDVVSQTFSIPNTHKKLQMFTCLLTRFHIIHRYKKNKFFVPCLLDHPPENINSCQEQPREASKLEISFKEAFVPPSFYHVLLVALTENTDLKLFKEGDRVWIYNLYARFTFEKATIRVETYWRNDRIVFKLENYSRQCSIYDQEEKKNRIEQLIDIIKERIRHVLEVFRHINTKFSIKIECPRHPDMFVDWETAKKDKEAMCTHHAVLLCEILKVKPFNKEENETKSTDHTRPSEKQLGRLARQLSHENTLSLTSKLGLSNITADQIAADYKHLDLRLFHVLRRWVLKNKDKSLETLLHKLTKHGDYCKTELQKAISQDVKNFKWPELDEASDIDASPPGEKELAHISEFVGENYTFLMLELGLEVYEMENTDRATNLPGTICNMLRKCCQKTSGAVTVKRILNTAEFLGYNCISMNKKLREHYQSKPL